MNYIPLVIIENNYFWIIRCIDMLIFTTYPRWMIKDYEL